jgi:hypothetical protein
VNPELNFVTENVRLYPRSGVSSVLVMDTDEQFVRDHPVLYAGCGIFGGALFGGAAMAVTEDAGTAIPAGALGAVLGAGVGYAMFHEKVDTHDQSDNRRGSQASFSPPRFLTKLSLTLT